MNLITRLKKLEDYYNSVYNGVLPHKSDVDRQRTHAEIAADVMGLVPEKLDNPNKLFPEPLEIRYHNDAIDQVVRGLTDYFGLANAGVEHSPETKPPRSKS